MNILIIITGLIILIGYLLYASVNVRFRYEEAGKIVTMSYTAVGITFDITKRTGRLSLAWIPIYRFDLKKKRKKKKKKKEVAAEIVEKKAEKKVKKKRKFGLSDLKLKYLSMAKALMSGIRIRQLQINISGGYREPFYTGKMFAYYCAARGMYPRLMAHVIFFPDFTSEKLTTEGKGLVSLRMFYIFRFVFGINSGKW